MPVNGNGDAYNTAALINYTKEAREMIYPYITPNLSDGQYSEHQVVVVLIDEIDSDLESRTWSLHNGYAATSILKKTVPMHRIIMARILERPLNPGEEVDHINGNRLDNRRSNLRLVNRSQNAKNRKASSKNKSGYLGVRKHPKYKRWYAYITSNKVQHYLGSFDTPELAYEAYCRAAIELNGEFASHEAIEYLKGVTR